MLNSTVSALSLIKAVNFEIHKKAGSHSKKVRVASGVWQFVSMEWVNDRYVWDQPEGYYFLEWWEGRRRYRC